MRLLSATEQCKSLSQNIQTPILRVLKEDTFVAISLGKFIMFVICLFFAVKS